MVVLQAQVVETRRELHGPN